MEQNAKPVSLGSYDLLRGRTVCGTLFGGLKPKLDIPILVDRYLKKVYTFIYLQESNLVALYIIIHMWHVSSYFL